MEALAKEYHFICSGNQSLISNFYDLWKVHDALLAAPGPGTILGQYQASPESLGRVSEETKNVPFAGKRYLGTTAQPVATVGDFLRIVTVEKHVFLCELGGEAIEAMHLVYNQMPDDAHQQGILPFWMYVTSDGKAAQSIVDCLSKVRG